MEAAEVSEQGPPESGRKRRSGLSRLAQSKGLLSPNASDTDLRLSPRQSQSPQSQVAAPTESKQIPALRKHNGIARSVSDDDDEEETTSIQNSSTKPTRRSAKPLNGTGDSSNVGGDLLQRSRSFQELERLNEWDRGGGGHSKRLNRLERRFDSSVFSLAGGTDAASTATTSASVASSGGGGSSAMRRIPVGDARRQPLLHGAVAAGGLLGAEQLDLLVPERRLELMAVTWNMNEASPKVLPDFLDALVFPPEQEHMPDIYSFSAQEVCSDVDELLIRIQATLGPTHVLFEYCHFKSLLLALFIRRDLVWFVSIPDTCAVQTRASYYTKGCAAICFTLFGSSMLFLSCHFKADEGRVEARVEDFRTILEKVDLPKFTKPMYSSKDVTERFDYVIWAGDLNFRLQLGDESRLRVERLLNSGVENIVDKLTALDELKMAQAEGRVFEHFMEGDIRFPPTYKFDLNCDNYDTSGKQRVPSYTDRILYRCRKPGSAIISAYNSIRELRCSDHRPVYAVVGLKIRPGSDNASKRGVPLAYGRFRHTFYVEGNKRRARQHDLGELERRQGRTTSGVCSLM